MRQRDGVGNGWDITSLGREAVQEVNKGDGANKIAGRRTDPGMEWHGQRWKEFRKVGQKA